MSEEGESPQPEEQQPPQQQMAPTFTAYPAYAESSKVTQRRRARNQMCESPRYASVMMLNVIMFQPLKEFVSGLQFSDFPLNAL
jgi:hypothetical protein